MSTTGPLIIPSLPAAGSPSFNSTLKQMRDRVYYTLRDDDRAFVTAGMVDHFLNEGYLDISSRLRLLKAETTGTTTATGTIPFPTGYIEVESLWLGTTLTVEVPDDVFDSYKIPAIVPDSIIYRIFNGNFELYGDSTEIESTAYTLRFVKIPTKLSIDTETFTALPAELEVRLANYARAHLRWLGGDFDDGDRYMEIYRSGLPDYPRSQYRTGKGPSQFTPAPGVFDE